MFKTRYETQELVKRGGEGIDKFRNIYDPVYIGPGVWYLLHREALEMEPDSYIKMVEDLAKKFFCEICEIHFKKYLEINPPRKYKNVYVGSEKLGLFLWSWQFHNEVNLRIGKPQMSWQAALSLYQKNGQECEQSCKLAL